MTGIPSWLIPLELPMPATLGKVNVYLIRGPRGTALIDTGMNDATSRQELVRQLGDQGLALSDIDTLVCTHGHADHAGLGKTFADAGAATIMSREDAESLAAFFADPDMDSERATFFGRHAVPDAFAERVAPMFPFFRNLSEEFVPTELIGEERELDLGGVRFEVLVTPGHTRGHICLRAEQEGVLFTGDCVTSSDATHISMRADVIGTDPLRGFLESLDRLQKLEVGLALSGHGAPIKDLGARVAGIIAHHRMRLSQIEETLAESPRPAFDISVDAMGPRPKTFARWLAMSQALAYLEHLVQRGRAVEVENEHGLGYALPPG